MNIIPAIITDITRSGGVVLVDLESNGVSLSALLVDEDILPDWLTKGASVSAVFKESELSIAVDFTGKISLRNRFSCTVAAINYGEVMSVIELKFGQHTIHSAITTRSVNALELTTGTQVTALIKANEISLIKSETGDRRQETGKTITSTIN